MVKLEQISRVYHKKGQVIHAVDAVDLAVERGGFAAIVGPSGSGKTTLMNVLGLLDAPTSGQYRLDGSPVIALTGRRAAALRGRSIGFIFQSFNLLYGLTALENTELPLVLRGVAPRARRERALLALRQVGLEDRARHRPAELSGGQQQRVAIARVLAAEPPLILADEPTGNLDSAAGREVIATLSALHALGRTVIMITHDTRAASAAQQIFHMENGRISM